MGVVKGGPQLVEKTPQPLGVILHLEEEGGSHTAGLDVLLQQLNFFLHKQEIERVNENQIG